MSKSETSGTRKRKKQEKNGEMRRQQTTKVKEPAYNLFRSLEGSATWMTMNQRFNMKCLQLTEKFLFI